MDVKQHFNNNFREKEELELERKNLDSQRIVALGPAGPVKQPVLANAIL